MNTGAPEVPSAWITRTLPRALGILVAAVALETEAEVTQEIRQSAQLRTAEFSVFHVLPGEQPRLLGVETHSAPV